MSEDAVLEIGRNGIWVVLQLSGPIMAAGLLIGLVIALFQALTTIQEMTLTFVPKIIVIFVSLLIFLPFMMTTLIEFSQNLFGLIATMG
ncbi:MAG: flagellar biosynthesis protein FliQ [Rhodospirillales bacterium]|nr:flagellar biosynthesis protein FliQ [Rhodospirillales bacterium]